jgi:glutathione synthase/RimK-type ligase-like ATP-grasp enzyme
VLVIDCKAVAAMERRSPDGGFKANISLGGVASLWRRLTRSLAALLGPPQPHSADP